MKALHFDGQKMTFLTDYDPPKPGETLVKINLAGICGTDIEILSGYMSYQGILGHEFVGVIKESQDTHLIGKRVVGEINVGCGICELCKKGLERHCPHRTVLGILRRDGAFAQYLSLPEKNLHVIPDQIRDEQAVFVEPLAAAFEIKQQIKLKLESNIALVGDGRLAQLVALVLNLSCQNITCFGRHKNKLELLKNLGIKTKIGIDSDDNQKFDLVVEATGSNSGFTDSMKLIKPKGTVILKSTLASKTNLDLTSMVINEVSVIGSRCGPFGPAINALASGRISVDNLIDSTYSLEKFQDAFEQAKKPDILKVLLKP
jgi:threonine dehydrogenase-like Zn-dependent dehydrogenase